MNVLSLYDGMSCGMIAFRQLGIPVDEYHAYEIDKFAVKVSQHNFPEIIFAEKLLNSFKEAFSEIIKAEGDM